jgi:hypothetical protein
MNPDQLQTYWMDQFNQISLNYDNPFEEQYLLADLDSSLKEWDKHPDIGLPFYQAKQLTKITTGWSLGTVFVSGGFGGKGKTSFTFAKVIMSCIENKEKLVVIANEQSIDEFKKLLFTTAMGIGTEEWFNRQRLNEGEFTDDERGKLQRAKEWVRNLCDNEKLIVFIFMEQYTMSNVKKVLTHYANRGYKRVIIDTGKPGDGRGDKARWEQFADDMKDLYKMARPNGGGLNLAVWVNVQLADGALGRRFLNEHAFGDSKKIKNEASVVFMSRPVWDDEYAGGNKELTLYRRVFNEITDEWETREEKLERWYTIKDSDKRVPNQYYLMFVPKNRRGQDNNTGLDVLVMRVDFGKNLWQEIGYTKVWNDHNYV